MANYLSFVFFWLFFFAVHSILASSRLKNYVNKLTPIFKSYYRIIFNIIAILLLFPILYIYYKLPNDNLFSPLFVYEISGIVLAIIGTFVLIDGFKNYRTDEFIGTYQIKNHHEFHPSQLSRSGWNGIVRHPLYFGGILLVIGLFLITPTIKLGLSMLLVLAYLYVGSIWEE
jgi:protein-S-isoprenylcysteine O-methyltransferase Ste14